MKNIITVSAGLSQPSSTTNLINSITAEIMKKDSESNVTHYELKEYGHSILDRLFTGFSNESLAEMMKSVEQADGLVLATPIFNTGPSGLFKTFLDILEPGKFDGMPVLLAATGGSDRHSLSIEYSIRPIMTYLHMEPITTSIYASTDDWGRNKDNDTSLNNRISRGVSEFVSKLNNGVITHSKPVDEFDPTNYLNGGSSFEDLLANVRR